MTNTLKKTTDPVAWQIRERSLDPDDAADPWSNWREVSEHDLEVWRSRVKHSPQNFELRQLFTHSPDDTTLLFQVRKVLEWFIKNEMTIGHRYTNEGQEALDVHAALQERLGK